jgi:hypothetical protein
MIPCAPFDAEGAPSVSVPCSRVATAQRAGRPDTAAGSGRRLRPEYAAGSDQIAGRALAMARHPSWDGDVASYVLVAQSGGRPELLEDALSIVRPDPTATLDALRARAASSIGQALTDLAVTRPEVDIDLTGQGLSTTG